MEYFMSAMKNYAGFSGRARRAEFWWFALIAFVLYVVAIILDNVLGTVLVVYGLLWLALVIPSLAVSIRRLHDTGRSGWFLLLNLVPFGGLVLLYFFVQEGDSSANQYGPNPKA